MDNEKKYTIPENHEEAVKRKEEVLAMINAYNEAIFAEEEPPYTDEEIDLLQEEYQILNDRVALTEKEKIAKLDEKDVVVNEDGTISRKTSVLDQIHFTVFIYIALFLIVSTLGGYISISIGFGSMEKYIHSFFDEIYFKTVDGWYYYSDIKIPADMMIEESKYWVKCLVSYLWLPLVFIALIIGGYIGISFIGGLSKKVTKIAMIILLILTVGLFCLYFFVGKNGFKYWMDYYDNIQQRYFDYALSLYQQG